MKDNRYSIGIDFGSNSVRVLIMNLNDGCEVGIGTADYPGGENGVFTSPDNPHLARQLPADYLTALTEAMKSAINIALEKTDIKIANIIGIGVDTTGSTPIPVDDQMTPLADLDKFKNNLNAYAWMWKDHTSMEEAEKITVVASEIRPQYLAKCGGTYSSEWFFSKLWHCLNVDEEVYNAAASWVEFADFIPAVLAGITNPHEIKRGVCPAGHKAMYCEEWDGLPDKEFLSKLDQRLESLPRKLYKKADTSDKIAGFLCEEWAGKLGLPNGIPISVGSFDAHLGAVGAGVGKAHLVKIIGTSSCDIMVTPNTEKLPDIPGVCGIVDGSVIPGYYGIEAGQSAVGDIFNWFVTKVCGADHDLFKGLSAEAEKLKPGGNGLIALDWNNGNRTILVDPKLSGLLLGTTLHTSQAEIYRALLEATAFGARKIIDRLEEYNVHIEEIINCGGIAEKNPLFMQIYADVLNRPMKISGSAQTCALGAAIFGAVVAGREKSGFDSVEDIQKVVCTFKDKIYQPKPENVAVYNELYELYSELHDSFGVKGCSFDHSSIMKKLMEISSRTK